MEFSRQEYWIRGHFLLQGIFLTQGSNPPCIGRRVLHHWAIKEASPLTRVKITWRLGLRISYTEKTSKPCKQNLNLAYSASQAKFRLSSVNASSNYKQNYNHYPKMVLDNHFSPTPCICGPPMLEPATVNVKQLLQSHFTNWPIIVHFWASFSFQFAGSSSWTVFLCTINS